MSALIPAHRRAERFAAMVDETTSVGVTDLRALPLLGVVESLRSVATAASAPRPAYVEDLRARLMAEADTALVPTDRRLRLPATPTARRQGRVTAAAAAVIIVAGSTGMSFAARSSLPGESLYSLKLGIEATQEALTFSDGAQGNQLLDQAGSRLNEADELLNGKGSDAQVASTLDAFTKASGQGADLLFRSYQSNADTSSVASVRDFAGTSMGQLTDLASHAPASLRPSFLAAAQLLADLDQQARVLCADCGARSPLEMPSDLSLSSAKTLQTLLGDSAAKTDLAPDASANAAGPAKATAPTKGVSQPALPDVAGTLGDDTPGSTTAPKIPATPKSPIKLPLGLGEPKSGSTTPPTVPEVVKNLTDGVTGTVNGVTGTLNGVVGGLTGTPPVP